MAARDMGWYLLASGFRRWNTTGLIYSAGATMCSSVVLCPSISTRIAERNGKNATANNPAVNPPVTSFSYPITYGATKPARLPIELISAIPPAAAVPLGNAAGNVQNNGAIANRPIAQTESEAILCTGSGK